MLSLVLLAAAIASFVFGDFLFHTRDFRFFGALFVVFTIPSFFGSLILAVIGLIECLKYPERYPRGQPPATITLTFGCTLIVLFAIGAFAHRKRMAAEMNHVSEVNQEGINFNYFNFVFHPPGPPWKRVDPRKLNRTGVLAFATDDDMIFTLNVTPLNANPLIIDPLKQITELTKENVRRISTSYSLLNEGEKERNNLIGWQLEERLSSKEGHNIYMVNWLLATNGFGYQLSLWGPVSLQPQVRDEADRLFAGFKLTPPGQ